MSSKGKQILTAVISVLVIAGSATWIYWSQFKVPKHDVGLHKRVGEVMAEQAAKLAGGKGRLVLITISTHGRPELATQLTAFKQSLPKLGKFELKEDEVDTEGKPKYGLGSGLSGRHFVRTVKKNESAAAIVSFVGAPKLTDEEIAELQTMPKFIAETRSPDHLPKLFQKKIIQVAVASRFIFPAPGPIKPRTPQEWFDKRYQVLADDGVSTIPKPE